MSVFCLGYVRAGSDLEIYKGGLHPALLRWIIRDVVTRQMLKLVKKYTGWSKLKISKKLEKSINILDNFNRIKIEYIASIYPFVG